MLQKDSTKIPNKIAERRLEKCVDDYYNTINEVLEKACPKTRPQTRDHNNPWRSKHLKQKRRELNKLYRVTQVSDYDLQIWFLRSNQGLKITYFNFSKCCKGSFQTSIRKKIQKVMDTDYRGGYISTIEAIFAILQGAKATPMPLLP